MRLLSAAPALAALAAPALAHTGPEAGTGIADGLLHGLAHPVLGLDHLLAMVAVGLWSGLALPDRPWAGAAAFLAAMTSGAVLALAGVALPLVEAGIAASVVAFGLLALLARPGQPPALSAATLAAIAAFALLHGHAHGAEAAGDRAGYLAGFLATTAALHLAGIGLARGVIAGRAALQRLVGAGIAGSGLVLALA